jgi:MFS family permease
VEEGYATQGTQSVTPANYKRYLLGILLVTFSFNTQDRLLFGLAMQDIKVDLALSDTQLGLLTGIAFALFYSIMGIPIARWADRGDRVKIIAVCTALWSGAVALCGAATSFAQLLLIRVAVAIGEAGCIPPSHSLIADHFSRSERPRAIAIFQLGAPLSALVGYFLAGWLIELYGWRSTFVWLSLPGVVLAVIAWVTLREPRRNLRTGGRVGSRASHASAAPNMKEIITTLWGMPTFRHLLFGFAVLSFFSNGIAQWNAAFFMRSHGLSAGELGTWFTVMYGGLGLLGTYLGGVWASKKASGNERLQLTAAAIAYLIFGVVSTGIYLTPGPYVAIALSGLAAMGTFAVSGPLYAVIQTLVPQRMRAVAVALIFLFISLIGTGLGPLAVGVLSDVLRSTAGEESLRYALLALSPGYVWAAYHFWKASVTVMDELAQVPIERTEERSQLSSGMA